MYYTRLSYQMMFHFTSSNNMSGDGAPDLHALRETTDEAIEEVRLMYVEKAANTIADLLDVEIAGQVAEEIADRVQLFNAR